MWCKLKQRAVNQTINVQKRKVSLAIVHEARESKVTRQKVLHHEAAVRRKGTLDEASGPEPVIAHGSTHVDDVRRQHQ